MQTFLNNKIKLTLALFTIAAGTLLSSCLDNDGTDSSSIVSAVSVIHASPDSPGLEFVIDNQRVERFTYGDNYIPYFVAYSGNRFARVYEQGSFNRPLYEFELKLTNGKYYSVFIAGKKDELSSLILEDDLTSPGENATVRFVHLSPDAPALDFNISADSTLASNKKFKEHTGFQLVTPGTYNIVVKSYGSDESIFNEELTFKEGEIYTVWAKGLIDTEEDEQKFGVSIITHNVD